ncbi:GNAT family N-acetyltransferase [Krasilnikovia sp. MM14-A1259]|uniref:GNAT family N-acetyltransferase n=1 Tax=Krasilnikovia sp. MM14-A1259 TaxID=3373539 RepID=UPI0038288B86
MQAAPTPESLATVIALRRDTTAWLQAHGQDQWSQDFPDTDTMIDGFRRDLQDGSTWFARAERTGDVLAAITINRGTHRGLWSPEEEASALFVHRLTINRAAAGRGIGAQLLDFAGAQAETDGLPWVRLDAWTTNRELHRYYLNRGFRLVRIVPNHFTPSAACFERPAAYRGATGAT